MLNLPVPYPDELVYSTVARAGVHMGITSPKHLLDEVFGNRHVIATIDFPNYLQKLSSSYPPSLNLTVENLIYKHTLFPVYAPFIPEDRRRACINLMAGATQGAIHLASGAAASRLKQASQLRYCPHCLDRQLEQFGEYYWMRSWQLAGANCCMEHGQLLHDSLIKRHDSHRHQFIALQPDNITYPSLATQPAAEDLRSARFVSELLALPPLPSPSPHQWTCFYQEQAKKVGCCRGRYIRFEEIRTLVLSQWSQRWLQAHHLYPEEHEAAWLKSIFRKHRKAFSYLEHCIVLDSFSPDQRFCKILETVHSFPPASSVKKDHHQPGWHNQEQLVTKRNQWELLLPQHGPKASRAANGALYAWLYRHDRGWLMGINDLHRTPQPSRKSRIDWLTRDKRTESELCTLKQRFEHNLTCPRKSKNWYLSSIHYPSTIAKNLKKLPRTKHFLKAHSESIALYQCRRIIEAELKLRADGYPITRWRLLRAARLSELRLSGTARHFLVKVLLTYGQL